MMQRGRFTGNISVGVVSAITKSDGADDALEMPISTNASVRVAATSRAADLSLYATPQRQRHAAYRRDQSALICKETESDCGNVP